MFLSKTLSFFEKRNRIVTIVVKHIIRGDFQKGLRSRFRVSIVPRLNRSQEKDKTKRTLKPRIKLKSLPRYHRQMPEAGLTWDPWNAR